jgi:hypothetical protein
MQYFTPELFVRLQDLTDRGASADWDRAAERYSAALQQTLPRLPASVRKLVGQDLLHDAEVLCIAQSRDNLSVTLQPERADGRLLVLSYTLVEEPTVNRAAIPDKYRTEYIAWMYDEFDLREPTAGSPSRRRGVSARNGPVPVYCHDILLSNGWELFLRFRQLKVTRPQRLLPAPRSAEGDGDAELSRSA